MSSLLYDGDFESWEHLICMWHLEIQDHLGPTAKEFGYLGAVSEDVQTHFQAKARFAGAASWFAIWKYRAHCASVTTVRGILNRLFL